MHEEGLHIALKAEEIGHLFGIPITNTMVTGYIVMAVILIVGLLVGSRLKKIPGKVQTLFESVVEFFLKYMEEVLESRTLALTYFPIVFTLFFFILLGNWLGLLPGVGSIFVVSPEGHGSVELFHPIATDLNITLALAFVAFISIEIAGISMLGLKYFGKFVNLKSVIGFLVGIIELISEFVRIISFSFRLFGNMFAGKTLILVAMFFVPYILPVPLLLYEVGVGFIQASIFALLTLFFIKLAVAETH